MIAVIVGIIRAKRLIWLSQNHIKLSIQIKVHQHSTQNTPNKIIKTKNIIKTTFQKVSLLSCYSSKTIFCSLFSIKV